MLWDLCPFHFGSQCVTLKKGGEPVVLTHIDAYGVYSVDVVDEKDGENGTKAAFSISANKVHGGTIMRLTCVPGVHGEHVTITWDAGQQHPRLKYQAEPEGPSEQTYHVKFRKCA